jgi:putative tryptophan/tyrosine transport system substrate-binding protein
MRRRQFLALLGGAAAWPLTAHAQQSGGMRRVGILMPFTERDPEGQTRVTAFREGLQKLGWTEGRDIRIDYRWASDATLMPQFAKELVALKPELILASSTPATASIVEYTRTIPIVFVQVTDPIGAGFVTSLARPGGNVTGFITVEPTMAGKWVELLKEIAPRVTRVAAVFNPATAPFPELFLNAFKVAATSFALDAIVAPIHDISELDHVISAQAREPNGGVIVLPDIFIAAHRAEAAARTLGVEVAPLEIRRVEDFSPAFQAIKAKADALYVAIDQLMVANLMRILTLALGARLPTIFSTRDFVRGGGFMSYGPSYTERFGRAADYVDKILRGTKPGDIPVEQPTKFELVVNLITAQALGLEVPPTLLARADEVIE